MSKGALVVGGSPAGLQAALDLADAGIQVHLVEPAPFLGREGADAIPRHLLNARLLEASKHPNITVWTNTRLNRLEGKAGHFYVELRQHPRYVDLARCTACGDCLAVCPVTVFGSNRKAVSLEGQPACAAIEKLGKAPCANTCPGGVHVQGYVALIAQGRFQEAIELIRAAIPFPGICGRVCTHPCEINCRRAEVDTPVAIRLLKRFVSDWELKRAKKPSIPDREPALQKPKGERVAIVGAGPGGMAVADRLARLGYQVTVFEKLPVIGGMMAIGIPEYRLPGEVIAREYQHIQDLGVEIRLNTTIGPGGEATLDDLFAAGYAAVCLAIGAHQSQALRIPGEDLPGVVHGLELLKAISLAGKTNDPRCAADLQQWLRRGAETRAAVLGGGNTAMDVSRSLRRLGLKEVRILYRRSRQEMPAMPEEVEDAQREGVKIEFLVSPVRVLGEAGTGATGLECVRMKLGEPDASGRRRPIPIAGSQFVVDLDLVVPAIGQTPELNLLGQDHGLAVTREERINVADASFMTNRPAVFAVGDAVTTDRMAVIEAIGMGKKAAAAIDAYLRKQPLPEIEVDARRVPIARREMSAEELVAKPRLPVPIIPLKQRLSSFKEVERGYTAAQAVAEAQRCLVCSPCSECLACEQACKAGAVIHEQGESFAELDIAAIICADGPQLLPMEGAGLYRVPPEDPLLGSAAAQLVMHALLAERQPAPLPSSLAVTADPARIGVFICQCGGEIAQIVDTGSIRERVSLLPDVVHAQVVPFACSPEAAQVVQEGIDANHLNHAVLAACSCCPADQVCYSCTYQRVRCKDNLGLFPARPRRSAAGGAAFTLVNIREQCAWVHADNPRAATDKAAALVAGAVAASRGAGLGSVEAGPVERSALILGSGAAGRICQSALSGMGIAARHVEGLPARVQRAGGGYLVTRADDAWKASVMVLAPRNSKEAKQLASTFGRNGRRPRVQSAWGGLDTHRPGVFLCDPARDPAATGAAVAARAVAWLGRMEGRSRPMAAVVDPARCRACATCTTVCEYEAPQLVTEGPRLVAWIDPDTCTGCGTCAAHCPSGAITAGCPNAAQLEDMLDALLA